ncbi:MAG: type II secretion system protein GspE [Deltaproteobacteria bacterium]|nr:type II secretion system protein GspE [Deltaproteobacteria bacterium]
MAEEKKSYGDFLVDRGIITTDQLKKAVQEQKRAGERLEQTIVRLNYAPEDRVLQGLADYFSLPFIDLNTYLIDEKVIKIVPEEVVRRHTLMPLFKIGNTLTVAMVNPLNIFALDEVRNRTKCDVEIAISTAEKVKKAIDQHYGFTATSLESTLKEYVRGQTGEISLPLDYRKTYDLAAKDLPSSPTEDIPASRMFDVIMMQAIRDRSSDIHLEPEEKVLRVRFRIDGLLFEFLTLSKQIHPPLTSCIKILAEMDIAETRLPQDGNFNVKIENRSFEIRVSTFPTIYGENVVLRILDQSTPLRKLEDLGFADNMLARYKQLIQRPNGMLLVTGPTGSGKTSTLYASLNMINSMEKNIVTVEDPVEYRLALIRQTQVNPKAGITFATGLRSILRQDPDVIMVGEIRDLETSEVAMQAALTGHLVLSTLHTNDAPEAISRLRDIGVEPYMISSAVIGVLAQRLIRSICPECKVPYAVDPQAVAEFGEVLGKELSQLPQPLTLYRGKGCKNCKQSGYWGRVGIFELLWVNEKIKQLIADKTPTQLIRETARETLGMISLREDGLQKALQGKTTLEEVDRVAYTMQLG